jgi:hypothetical protein
MATIFQKKSILRSTNIKRFKIRVEIRRGTWYCEDKFTEKEENDPFSSPRFLGK